MRMRKIPAAVWALGLTSLWMDVSSEMIHSLLPLFLVQLGASVAFVGVLEGLAEATALVAKVFSGALSDAIGHRKRLALLGYALGAATKPLFALAPGPGTVLAARLTDRVGKGIRGAPRDALVAAWAPEDVRGAAFGLRQSLDTVGAVLGPALAIGLMIAWGGDIRAVFAVAIVPGLLAVATLGLGVHEPPEPPKPAQPLRWAQITGLGRPFWRVTVGGAAFTLARASEAFLVLRAQDLGWAPAAVPLVMVVMSVVYALSAYPVGALSDRVSPRGLLALGLVALVAADVALAAGALWPGVGLWGLHLGLTQGLWSRRVADVAPADLRGTAFGVFHLAGGVATLLASAITGAVWSAVGPEAAFGVGAALAMAAALAL